MKPFLYKVTHCEHHYTGAAFVANCTEVHDRQGNRKVSEAEAVGMYAAHKQKLLAEGWKPIFSNVFGTWLQHEAHTVKTHVGWGTELYLQDTPVPMTKGTFWYMLEVLFPVHWIGINSPVETFQISELQTGNITSTMLRVGDAYWHTYETMGTPQSQIVANVREKILLQAEENGFVGDRKVLKCSCCGNHTMGRQFYNKDTGYGLCTQCLVQNSVHGADVNEMIQVFGLQGFHYATLE